MIFVEFFTDKFLTCSHNIEWIFVKIILKKSKVAYFYMIRFLVNFWHIGSWHGSDCIAWNSWIFQLKKKSYIVEIIYFFIFLVFLLNMKWKLMTKLNKLKLRRWWWKQAKMLIIKKVSSKKKIN